VVPLRGPVRKAPIRTSIGCTRMRSTFLEGRSRVQARGPTSRRSSGCRGTLAAASSQRRPQPSGKRERTRPAIFLNFHGALDGLRRSHPRTERTPFDQWEPPADGGLDGAVLNGPARRPSAHRGTTRGTLVIKSDLQQLAVLELTFLPEFEGVDPPPPRRSRPMRSTCSRGEVEFHTGRRARGEQGPGSFFRGSSGNSARLPQTQGRPRFRVLNVPCGRKAGFVGRVRDG